MSEGSPTRGRGTATSYSLHGGLSASFAMGLGLVVAIEGIVLHLWIASRSQPWAWAIAVLNIATIAWLWREYRSGASAHMLVDAEEIEIDAGSRLRCRFSRLLIASVEPATWRSVPDDFAQGWANTAKPLEPNVVVSLREPVRARLALGMRRSVWRIGIRVDDPEAVCAALFDPGAGPPGPRGLTPIGGFGVRPQA